MEVITKEEIENSSVSKQEADMNDTFIPKVVLLTGGAGFIGSHVAELLLRRGDRVVVVDEMNDYYDIRLKQANLEYLIDLPYSNNLVIYRGDICDIDFISNIFECERPTHICHLAARAGVRPSIADPFIYVHSNIEGTTRLLDLARQYSCMNFVYASSSSVYGCSENEVLSETDNVEKPVSPYAATKKACELLAYTFHHLYGLNCTGLRFFTVYGPRGRPDMAPYKFISRIYNGVPIQQFGDGSTSRDYTYIDDIVSGVVASIDRPLGCEVINLGNGRPFLLKDFISLVEKCVGKPAIIEILPFQQGDVDRTCADISKAKRLLDYSPKVPFEEGIRRTSEWYCQAHEKGLFSAPIITSTPSSSSSVNSNVSAKNNSTSTPTRADRSGSRSRGYSFFLIDPESENTTSPQPVNSSNTQPGMVPNNNTTTNSNTTHSSFSAIFGRNVSDLELSSYVSKAATQVKERVRKSFKGTF